MVLALGVTLTVLLQCILCYTPVSPLKVELSPKKPLFRVGDRQELTCRMIKCSEKMTFSWSSLQDKPLYAEPQTTSTESTLVFKSVSKNIENKIQCKATCQGMIKQAAVTVRVYSFPKVPVISGHDSLVLGKENSLTCEVSDVYPAEHMTVEWLRGGKVVRTQEGEYGIESIQSYYTFTPQTNDDGESITCRATLSLDGLPPEERTREITVSMAVLCPPMNTVISVSPNNPKEDEFMNISCVSDSNLASRLVLSKMLDGKETELVSGDGPRVSVSYDKANLNHSGVYVCRTTNACGRQTDNVTFTVGISSFEAELSPKKPLFRVGDRQELTCRMTKCSEKMTFSWSNLEDKPLYAEPQTTSTGSTLVFKSVSKKNEDMIQCKATCQGTSKQATVQVRVYSFPKVPVISGHDSLVLGKENSLTCEVSDVYPAENMTVEWLRGGKVVHTQEGEYGIESIQSYYTFTPQTNDDGESITCRATLSLDGLPPEERTREITVSMAVLCPPMNTVISVSPNNPKENEFMNISCVSDCNHVSRLVLSKMLDGKETELVSGDGPRVSVSYDKANLNHSGVYVCRTTNACGRQTDNVTFTVGTHPLEVSLQPDMSVIPVERGSSMMLSCNSSGCPHAHITWRNVTHQPLLSWNDTRAFVSQLGPWTLGLEDNRTFICEINCGSVMKSKHTELKVYSFPSDPTIESSGPFLEGKVTNLTCTVHEVFPVDCFHIQWLDGELELHSVRGNFSDKLQNLSLTIPFKPKDSDQNKTFTCKVSLEMEGVSTQKIASTTLTVHYSPKHTTIDVRPKKKLNEGETVTISCQTDSAPEGHVTLSRVQNGEETKLVSSNGTQTSFSISFTNVSHSGTYVCEAVNKYGHQRKSVQITVQAPPKNINVTVYPSKEVQEGETVKICCQLVSFPPSDITLRKLDNGNAIYSSNGIFLLVNLTSNDSGLYQVNATNALGSETEIFTIIVMSKRKDGGNIFSDLLRRLNSIDFIIPVIGLGILATVASSLECIRRAKRKGFYELTEGIPETV
ncbi:vascular cell adhesion protein 1 isoform X1 [Pangasianodon hypophthalmus]|uniref:vascular cell adhesion protein 1 isoform X1 n=1 Tax=Pangasianodon hypophthalmus TaxID=310915 RepID=UPI0023074835|nr:vascular cell adhesion protein 1 isoform X1 [Pangasianodon hypophthalmus]